MPTPEEEARLKIDAMLTAAGWDVQDRDRINLSAGLGVAVREFPLKAGHGKADYMLYADGRALGVVEAKPAGHPLRGVETQSAKYTAGLPDNLPAHRRPLPCAYESTGVETRFTNLLEPDARSRDVFHFHQPETLLEYGRAPAQLRGNLRAMPPLDPAGLWEKQATAIQKLERSLAHGYPRALIQMATGSGKTFTAANFLYRLLKHADARRILFLVDRANLGEQAEREFRQFHPRDDGRAFSDIYNIQFLRSNSIGPVNRVVITTIQRLYSLLQGEPDFNPANEQGSVFAAPPPPGAPPPPVRYNPNLPIEMFDFIIVDECHRSIYNLWRQVLEYFDAFLIGLTATPSKQTIGFFNRNLVMEYSHAQAVADHVNVDYDVYRINTRITQTGATVEAGYYVDRRDRLTRAVRYELLDDDLTYGANQLDRDVVAADQIRTVIRAFRDKLATEIFPGRTEVPKTLIFAKDDSHADDIVEIVREEFGRGNDFCQKITYRTGFVRVPQTVTLPDGTRREEFRYERVSNLTPDDILSAFCNSFLPRIIVTVDMLATGTDMRPLEILLFMRAVKSASFFEQMKGRGVRVIAADQLRQVTPDARHGKTHFVIVDAVGQCEGDRTETPPVNRDPTIPLKSLLEHLAMGGLDAGTLSTLASRLTRLDMQLSDEQRRELAALAGGQTLSVLAGALVRAADPDEHAPAARAGLPENAEPTEQQIAAAAERLAREAARPFHNPDLRRRLLEIKQRNEQTIDRVSQDEVLFAGFDGAAAERARGRIESFRRFIEENKDQIAALQLLYSGRWANRLKFEDVKELAERIQRPPLETTPETLWRAYEALDQAGTRGGGRQLVDLVALVRHAIRPAEPLTPFEAVVRQRYERWLAEQAAAGAVFTPEQRQWLDKIAEHIAASLTMERNDFELGWFAARGNLGKAHELFGERLDALLAELNEKLVA